MAVDRSREMRVGADLCMAVEVRYRSQGRRLAHAHPSSLPRSLRGNIEGAGMPQMHHGTDAQRGSCQRHVSLLTLTMGIVSGKWNLERGLGDGTEMEAMMDRKGAVATAPTTRSATISAR